MGEGNYPGTELCVSQAGFCLAVSPEIGTLLSAGKLFNQEGNQLKTASGSTRK